MKMWEICQMAGPISTKFGTHVRIHLGMDTAGPIGTKFGKHLQIHLGMDIC